MLSRVTLKTTKPGLQLISSRFTSHSHTDFPFQAAERLHVDYYSGGTSIWVAARQLLDKYNCVNHGQGFPNWETPDFVKAAAKNAIDAGFNQYSPPFGHPLLIEQLIKEYSQYFGRDLTSHNIQPTIGACGGVENCCQAFLNAGDEVVTFEPYFDFYKMQVGHTGSTIRTVPISLDAKNKQWTFDPSALRDTITDKTRLFLLNTPHNPTGVVFSKEQMESIVEVLQEFPNIIVVTDEVYNDLVFDDCRHYSIANFPSMWHRTVTVNSASKKFSATGWKIGWCIGPEELIHAVHFVTRGQSWCQASPLQVAVGTILEQASKPYRDFPTYWKWLRNMYSGKRDKVVKVIESAGMTPIVPQGSFFATAECSGFVEKLIAMGEIDPKLASNRGDPRFNVDWQAMAWIAKNAGVTTIPFSAFTDEYPDYHALRFSFCVKDDSLKQSLERMEKMRKLLPNL